MALVPFVSGGAVSKRNTTVAAAAGALAIAAKLGLRYGPGIATRAGQAASWGSAVRRNWQEGRKELNLVPRPAGSFDRRGLMSGRKRGMTTAFGKSKARGSPASRVTYRQPRANWRTGGFTGIELKFLDCGNTGVTIPRPTDSAGGEMQPTSGCVNSISVPAQGVGEQQRDGRAYVIKSVMLKGIVNVAIQGNQTATDVAPTVFVALVLDTQANGAALNSEDVFTNPGPATLASSPMRNLEFNQRFRILGTWCERLRQPTVVYDGTNIEQGGLQVPFTIYRKLNIACNTNATDASVASATDNAISVIAYTSDTGTAPVLMYSSRVRFVG